MAHLAPARATAARLGTCPAGVEVQVDRYYELEGGSRLKLRIVPGRPAELIRYRRPGVRRGAHERLRGDAGAQTLHVGVIITSGLLFAFESAPRVGSGSL